MHQESKLKSLHKLDFEVNKCAFTFLSEIGQIQCTCTEFWCVQCPRPPGRSAFNKHQIQASTLDLSSFTQKSKYYHRYTREIPEPAPFLSWHGTQIGVSSGSRNHNYHSSCGVYVTCIYCGLSMKINTRKTPHGWGTHLLCICFRLCGRQKPEDPQSEPMADDAITWSGTRGLGSPLYICGY